jgi:hypothetical protein
MIIFQSKKSKTMRKKKIHEEVMKIISDLLELQESQRAEVFISYYGHTKGLSIDIYSPSYYYELKPILRESIYLDSVTPKRLEEFKRKINGIIGLFCTLGE